MIFVFFLKYGNVRVMNKYGNVIVILVIEISILKNVVIEFLLKVINVIII